MRRYSLTILATVAAIAAMGSAVQLAAAADLPRKAPAYAPPPPPPPPDWSGFYVGLEGGYGWGKQDFDGVIPGNFFFFEEDVFPNVGVASGHHRNGGLFGGFAGAQKQWGSWVLGLEADFDGADLKGEAAGSAVTHFGEGACGTTFSDCFINRAAAESKIDMLGSVRGKVGWVPAPNWLIYGTGGLAYAHVKDAFHDTQTACLGTDCFNISTTVGAGGTSMVGWAAGAGVDWKWVVDAGSAWVFGVEYLHYGFGTQTTTLNSVCSSEFVFGCGFNSNNVSFTGSPKVDAIKGRISYLFSIH